MEPRNRKIDLNLQIKALQQDVEELRQRLERLEREKAASPAETSLLADVDYKARADEVRFDTADTIYE